MSCKFLLSVGFTVVALFASAQSGFAETPKAYVYTGKHGVDFSELTAESISIESIKDSPGAADSKNVTLASGEQVSLQQSPADLLQSALKQAFAAGNAPIADDGELKLQGEIVELTISRADNSIEVSLKSKLQLLSEANKTVWQNTVLGRASVSEPQGVDSALHKAVDKLIEELMFDDYFLMELVP